MSTEYDNNNNQNNNNDDVNYYNNNNCFLHFGEVWTWNFKQAHSLFNLSRKATLSFVVLEVHKTSERFEP